MIPSPLLLFAVFSRLILGLLSFFAVFSTSISGPLSSFAVFSRTGITEKVKNGKNFTTST